MLGLDEKRLGAIFRQEGLDEKYDQGLQVIGAGLSRTGTSSLKRALEILFNSKCALCHKNIYFFGKHAKQT